MSEHSHILIVPLLSLLLNYTDLAQSQILELGCQGSQLGIPGVWLYKLKLLSRVTSSYINVSMATATVVVEISSY